MDNRPQRHTNLSLAPDWSLRSANRIRRVARVDNECLVDVDIGVDIGVTTEDTHDSGARANKSSTLCLGDGCELSLGHLAQARASLMLVDVQNLVLHLCKGLDSSALLVLIDNQIHHVCIVRRVIQNLVYFPTNAASVYMYRASLPGQVDVRRKKSDYLPTCQPRDASRRCVPSSQCQQRTQ